MLRPTECFGNMNAQVANDNYSLVALLLHPGTALNLNISTHLFSFTLCVFIKSGRFAFHIAFFLTIIILDIADESVRYMRRRVVLGLGGVTYCVVSRR